MYKKSILLRTSAAVGNDVLLFAGEATSVDAYLRSTVGANANDVFLSQQGYNTADVVVAGPQTASSAAPISAIGSITATGTKATTSAAPVSATGVITASGSEGEQSAAPVLATGAITASGLKGESSAAPLAGTAAITAAGFKASNEAAPLAAVATVTAAGVEGSGDSAPLSAVGAVTAAGFKLAEGSASLAAQASIVAVGEAAQSAEGADPAPDTHDGSPNRKAPIVEDMAELRRRWAEEDANRQEAARRQDADRAARRRAISRALGTEPEDEAPAQIAIEISQERLKALTALLDYPKPTLTKPSLIDFKARRERKALIEADRKAREEARAMAERIKQEIRDYDDAIILLLLAA